MGKNQREKKIINVFTVVIVDDIIEKINTCMYYLKSYLFENMSEDMISMYFPPKFEFLNSDFA